MFAQLRQRGQIDALRAEHVGVIDLQELFGSEGFRSTENHVPGKLMLSQGLCGAPHR